MKTASNLTAVNELRRDPVVGRWVIVVQDEILRPEDYGPGEVHGSNSLSPFVYGRENMTPPEVAAVRPPDTAPNTPGWTVRVVPNKFPALKIEGGLDKHPEGIYDAANGVGAHEVVIETPDPDQAMADFSLEQMTAVIRVYRERCLGLAKDPRFRYIMIFKNYGRSAGASVDHEHSQIIALPMVPKAVQEKLEGARAYYRYRGRNVYRDILEQEYRDKDRIVDENEKFVCFCPYVPRYPFECWIFPKEPDSRFVRLTPDDDQAFGGLLKSTLRRLRRCLNNPAYNYYLHIEPVDYDAGETFLWHLEIVPSLSRMAGFEWGTGVYVVHTPPDIAARYLRKAGDGEEGY